MPEKPRLLRVPMRKTLKEDIFKIEWMSPPFAVTPWGSSDDAASESDSDSPVSRGETFRRLRADASRAGRARAAAAARNAADQAAADAEEEADAVQRAAVDEAPEQQIQRALSPEAEIREVENFRRLNPEAAGTRQGVSQARNMMTLYEMGFYDVYGIALCRDMLVQFNNDITRTVEFFLREMTQ